MPLLIGWTEKFFIFNFYFIYIHFVFLFPSFFYSTTTFSSAKLRSLFQFRRYFFSRLSATSETEITGFHAYHYPHPPSNRHIPIPTMKIFSTEHCFEYPWEQVSAANWKKYPNEMSTHVIAVDVLRREIDSQSGVLRTERLITCKQAIPSWVLALVGGSDVSYVREVSEVDPRAKTLTLRSVNLTMNTLLSVYETVVYSPNPKDPANSTSFTQEAQITAYASFRRLCNKIEDWSVDRFHQNAKLGKAGFESVLQKVAQKVQEGVFRDEKLAM